MISVELTALRTRWFELLSGVIRGETYLISHQGEIIAQLCPHMRTPDPLRVNTVQGDPVDPAISAILHRLSRAYGQPHLADLLGLSSILLHQAIQTGRIASHLLARLDYLEALHQTLLESRKSTKHNPWMTEPHRALGGRTPIMALRGAWEPDDALPRHISTLAKKANRA